MRSGDVDQTRVRDVVAIVLAGGKGSRLEPLTRDRAKPAVPFGGNYRIIDFALSNCLNSGLRKLLVLTQYKAISLDRHIHSGWDRFFCRDLGEFLDILPPQQRVSRRSLPCNGGSPAESCRPGEGDASAAAQSP